MQTNHPNRFTIIFQLLVMGGIFWAGIAGLNYLGSAKSVKTSSVVRFEVQASGGFAMVTLKTKDGDLLQPMNVNVPWSETLKVESGTTVILTASNPSLTGEITCNIRIDGTAWKKETTMSPKNGVACAGIVP